MDLKAFVSGMPKAELHMHLEGALEPDLVRTLAARNHLPIPASSQGTRTAGYDFHDLPSFLAVYYANMAVLRTSADFSDLAWSYLGKAAAQNVLHCELFFDPQAHTSRGVPFSTVVMGYRRAIVRAEAELKISAALIMCFLRDMAPGFAMATLVEALPYKEWIVGVGLDSDERDHPPAEFADVFKRAREEGFLLTCHCDVDQKDSVEHIRQAVEDIGVDRIDHGTNVVEDARLVEMVRKRGIGLTCCPVSNGVVTEDFKGQEILSLLRGGIAVTINSDDPAYFRAYATENMLKMADGTDVTKDELVQLQVNAFNIAWISARKREIFLDRLREYASQA